MDQRTAPSGPELGEANAWVCSPSSAVSSSVILGKGRHVSGPQFPHVS